MGFTFEIFVWKRSLGYLRLEFSVGNLRWGIFVCHNDCVAVCSAPAAAAVVVVCFDYSERTDYVVVLFVCVASSVAPVCVIPAVFVDWSGCAKSDNSVFHCFFLRSDFNKQTVKTMKLHSRFGITILMKSVIFIEQ